MARKNQPGCPCCGSTTGPGFPSGCACVNTPAILHITGSTNAFCAGVFQDCDLTWQAAPANMVANGVPAMTYLSDQTFFDASSGDNIKWNLFCESTFVRLRRVYLSTGSADAVLYAWSIGTANNVCSPFGLNGDGFIYPGGNPGCKIYVNP